MSHLAFGNSNVIQNASWWIGWEEVSLRHFIKPKPYSYDWNIVINNWISDQLKNLNINIYLTSEPNSGLCSVAKRIELLVKLNA